MTAVDDLGVLLNQHIEQLHTELDAYSAWLREIDVEIVPRAEIVEAMQDIETASRAFAELAARATPADTARLIGLVQKIGIDAIHWGARLRDEREALKKNGLN